MIKQVVAIAVLAVVCGSAEAQNASNPPPIPRTYAEAIASLPSDCVRMERETFLAFGCGDWNWFFTKPGQPAHPGFERLRVYDLSALPTNKRQADVGKPRLYRQPELTFPSFTPPSQNPAGHFENKSADIHDITAWLRSVPWDWRARRP